MWQQDSFSLIFYQFFFLFSSFFTVWKTWSCYSTVEKKTFYFNAKPQYINHIFSKAKKHIEWEKMLRKKWKKKNEEKPVETIVWNIDRKSERDCDREWVWVNERNMRSEFIRVICICCSVTCETNLLHTRCFKIHCPVCKSHWKNLSNWNAKWFTKVQLQRT